MTRPREYLAYAIDVEGVLVRDKSYEPVDGSVEWFAGLSDAGLARVLVSNNTTHAPDDMAADLRRAGFDVTGDDIVSALVIGADLLESWGKTRLLWLGHPRLADWWRARGFDLLSTDSDDLTQCDAVVLGVNPELKVNDLDTAIVALMDANAELVALHRNIFWLDEQGQRRCGPGCFAAALAECSRREPVVVGKPKERIYRESLKRVGVSARDVLFISDDPVADLVTAKSMGMGTAFVLSGKYSDHAVLERLSEDEWPDIIADRPLDLDPGSDLHHRPEE